MHLMVVVSGTTPLRREVICHSRGGSGFSRMSFLTEEMTPRPSQPQNRAVGQAPQSGQHHPLSSLWGLSHQGQRPILLCSVFVPRLSACPPPMHSTVSPDRHDRPAPVLGAVPHPAITPRGH